VQSTPTAHAPRLHVMASRAIVPPRSSRSWRSQTMSDGRTMDTDADTHRVDGQHPDTSAPTELDMHGTAAVLGISREAVRKRITRGTLPARKVAAFPPWRRFRFAGSRVAHGATSAPPHRPSDTRSTWRGKSAARRRAPCSRCRRWLRSWGTPHRPRPVCS
jgi:hypothetical protein